MTRHLMLCILFLATPLLGSETPVYMANGVKIGEVDATSAIVWARLTQTADRNMDGLPFPTGEQQSRHAEPITNLAAMDASVPGAPGSVRLHYGPAGEAAQTTTTGWTPVDPERDFTAQIQLSGLQPGTRYALRIEGRPPGASAAGVALEGGFQTAPPPGRAADVRFAVVTCHDYPRRDDPLNGHKIYKAMSEDALDFFVHAGDILYYDKPAPIANNAALARFKWNRLYALPYLRSFHSQTSSYFMKDDHETLKNDAWPGQAFGDLTWEQGLAIFREQVPMGEKTYRTVRWGQDLQIWMVEGRDFRSANTLPDGPDKSIWGAEQKQWFFDTVKQSGATFRVLISPTPIVGPDRKKKNDNHANAGFKHEGDELRAFLGKQKNMFVICGDRHWQYVSVDPVSGTREYSVGAATDAHAGGFSQRKQSPMHEYLKIRGGYLTVAVKRHQGIPSITLTHRGVDGSTYHEDVHQAH